MSVLLTANLFDTIPRALPQSVVAALNYYICCCALFDHMDGIEFT